MDCRIDIDLKQAIKEIVEDNYLRQQIVSFVSELRDAGNSSGGIPSQISDSTSFRQSSANSTFTGGNLPVMVTDNTNENMLRKELEDLKEKLAIANSENEKLKLSACRIDGLEEIYASISGLTDNHKVYLKKLCKNISVAGILSIYSDENKIDQLHGYILSLAINNDKQDYENFKTLVRYFNFCIGLFNSLKDSSTEFIVKEVPPIGVEFDPKLYIKTSMSRQIGHISKIILPAYISMGKVKYQSVVEIQ